MRVGFAGAREPLWRWDLVRFRGERSSRGRISVLILVIRRRMHYCFSGGFNRSRWLESKEK